MSSEIIHTFERFFSNSSWFYYRFWYKLWTQFWMLHTLFNWKPNIELFMFIRVSRWLKLYCFSHVRKSDDGLKLTIISACVKDVVTVLLMYKTYQKYYTERQISDYRINLMKYYIYLTAFTLEDCGQVLIQFFFYERFNTEFKLGCPIILALVLF